MTHFALVAATGSDKASMVQVVDDLERKGLPTRFAYPDGPAA